MKILVIEDDLDLSQIIRRALESEGHQALAANDGKDGLLIALHQDVDLVILDLNLPSIEGWEVLERLRSKKTTPVLILTARDTLGDRIRGLDGGCDDFLIKPFHLEELRARVRALLRRSYSTGQERVNLPNGLVFDTRRLSLEEDGEVVELTGKEVRLLNLLVEASGGIVSRETIYERLFEDLDEAANVIEVYIYKLRQKLGRDAIETVRGLGYRLSLPATLFSEP